MTTDKLELLILGKRSSDNRAVTNMLLSRDFDEGDDLLTPEIKATSFKANQVCVSVTNTPGLMDSGSSVRQVKNNIEYALKQKQFKQGFHAVLIVCSYPVRWTPEEEDCMNIIKRLIGGEKNFQKFAIIVFTDTESLRRAKHKTFDQACQNYMSSEIANPSENSFGHFIRLAGNKCIFLVKDDDDAQNRQQLYTLIHLALENERIFTFYQDSLLAATPQNQPMYWMVLYLLLNFIYDLWCPPYKTQPMVINEEYHDYLKLLPQERPRYAGPREIVTILSDAMEDLKCEE